MIVEGPRYYSSFIIGCEAITIGIFLSMLLQLVPTCTSFISLFEYQLHELAYALWMIIRLWTCDNVRNVLLINDTVDHSPSFMSDIYILVPYHRGRAGMKCLSVYKWGL